MKWQDCTSAEGFQVRDGGDEVCGVRWQHCTSAEGGLGKW